MLQPKIKLTSEEMKYMALFESITGATTQDCVIDEKLGRIIFVAKQGDMGLAIGKGGKNINTLRRMTSRQIEVVEQHIAKLLGRIDIEFRSRLGIDATLQFRQL